MEKSATLIYNPNSGLLDLVTRERIQNELENVGYAVSYRPTEKEEDLDAVLDDVEPIVVAAGGDGTVRALTKRLLGRDVALAILPMGTANNISRALEVDANPLQAVAGLEHPYVYDFDVGHVEAPWGEDVFLELCGMGFVARALAQHGPEEERTLARAVMAFGEALSEYRSHHLRMTLDGESLVGDYAMAEVFNTPTLGPRLELAPQADPSDGRFDLLCVGAGDNLALMGQLVALLADEEAEPPAVELRRGKHLEISWDGSPVHVDAELRPPGVEWPVEPGVHSLPGWEGGTLTIEMEAGALRFLVPHAIPGAVALEEVDDAH